MRNRTYRMIVVVLVFAALLVGCGAPLAATGGPEPADLEVLLAGLGPDISTGDLAQLYATGAVTVIDVREEWEYADGRVPGATLIPLGTLADRVDEIPVDRPVVIVCRTDNRSGQAARFLRQQGLDNIHRMLGGMVAWQAAGHEIEK
jgi:rhodanese-related sulfurtransferase